ncbi:hypothetical protein FRC01_005760 [Tulasnella sp. 417]|nr:hypothetical protein FRC01_005760 [Tulasnella sp. 417]
MPAIGEHERIQQEMAQGFSQSQALFDDEENNLLEMDEDEDSTDSSTGSDSDLALSSASDDTDSVLSSSSSSSSSSTSPASNSDISITSQSSSSLESESDDDILEALAQLDEAQEAYLTTFQIQMEAIENTRVLNPNRVLKISQLNLVLDYYAQHDPKHFRRNLRVSPPTFDTLVAHIQDDPVFYSGSNHPQLEVRYQLVIALYQFGHFGNSASVEGVAQFAGVSAGSVVN